MDTTDSELVTIATFHDLMAAEFCKSLLEENGIGAFLPAECTAATLHRFWFLTEIRPIRLQVLSSEVERAEEVLREMEERGEAGLDVDDVEGEDEGDGEDEVDEVGCGAAPAKGRLGTAVFIFVVVWGILLAVLWSLTK